MSNNWFVLTGGPSTGKTSLQAELAKAGYATKPEIARLVIDEAVANGISVEQLRADEEAFQDTIVARRIAIEAELSPSEVIILDRGTQDSLAYLRYYDFALPQELIEACEKADYAQVFLLDPLDKYHTDYARTETGDFAERIQILLREAYGEFGMEPVIVPPLSLKERTAFIIDHIQKHQGVLE